MTKPKYQMWNTITREQAQAAWLEIDRVGPSELASKLNILYDRGVWLYEAYGLENYYGPDSVVDETAEDVPAFPWSESILAFCAQPVDKICRDITRFIDDNRLDEIRRYTNKWLDLPQFKRRG